MTVNNDAYPLQTEPAAGDWINSPDTFGIVDDEQEHVTGVSSGMSLAALTDIPTPYGIDVAKADSSDPQTADYLDTELTGFEPVMAALARLMTMYDGAVKTREVPPTRFSTQRYTITPGQTAVLALGDDPYRRRLLIAYIGAAGDQPTISNESGAGEGFPIPLASVYPLELFAVDEVWIQPNPAATGNAVVVFMFERDSE